MFRVIALFAVSLVLVALAAWINPQRHFSLNHWRLRDVSLTELLQVKDPLWVDVRSAQVFQVERISGAVLLPEAEWDNDLLFFLTQWSPDRVVVIYGDGGVRRVDRQVALRLLNDLPEMRIYLLKNGFGAWNGR